VVSTREIAAPRANSVSIAAPGAISDAARTAAPSVTRRVIE